MDAEIVRALQLIALQSAESRTYDGFVRGVCRWYSKTFATPLDHVLYDIPFNDVLLAYYEESFSNMIEAASGDLAKQKDWEQFRARLLVDPNDSKAQEEAAADSDEEWFARQLEQEISKEVKAAVRKTVEAVKKPSQQPNIQSEPPELTKSVRGEDDTPPEE